MGQSHTLGERGGEQAHTLTLSELPTHTHQMSGNSGIAPNNLGGTQPNNTKSLGQALAALQNNQTAPVNIYGTGGVNRALAPNAVSNVGGSQAHLNMQPFLTLTFAIALQGIFPSQN
jgi:microcystin-dependent protein